MLSQRAGKIWVLPGEIEGGCIAPHFLQGVVPPPPPPQQDLGLTLLLDMGGWSLSVGITRLRLPTAFIYSQELAQGSRAPAGPGSL